MELLTSLPPDLAALADPSARGAAPLLRPSDATGAPSAAAPRFDLLLALLTSAPPAGESWPPAGKELPVLALAAEDELDSAGDSVAEPLPAFAAVALPDAVLRVPLRSGEAPVIARGAPTVSLPVLDAQATTIAPPPSSGSPVSTAAAATGALADLDPLVALAATATEAAPERAAPPASATAEAAPAPSWLEALTTNERRLHGTDAATSSDARATTAPAFQTMAAAPAAASPAGAAAVLEAAAKSVGQGVELPKNVVAALAAADGSVGGSGDWLPPAATHGAATSAAAPSAASPVPQTPVDLRSPSWHEAFASRVQMMVDTQVGEARIKLNPPELGAVDVEISLVDDKTYVQLTTATAAARDELTQSLPRLRELFTVSGLELGGASVHNGRGGQPGGHGSGAETAAYASPLATFAADVDDPPARVQLRALGRIDTFA